MRALSVVTLVLLAAAAIPTSSALVGCQGPVCADVGAFNGSCDTFHMEYVRVLAPGVVVYSGRWCGAGFNGARADVVVEGTPAGKISVGAVWFESFGSCDTLFWASTEDASVNDGLGCPAGNPPPLPPIVGLLV